MNKKKIVILLICVVIISLVGIFAWFYISDKKENKISLWDEIKEQNNLVNYENHGYYVKTTNDEVNDIYYRLEYKNKLMKSIVETSYNGKILRIVNGNAFRISKNYKLYFYDNNSYITFDDTLDKYYKYIDLTSFFKEELTMQVPNISSFDVYNPTLISDETSNEKIFELTINDDKLSDTYSISKGKKAYLHLLLDEEKNIIKSYITNTIHEETNIFYYYTLELSDRENTEKLMTYINKYDDKEHVTVTIENIKDGTTNNYELNIDEPLYVEIGTKDKICYDKECNNEYSEEIILENDIKLYFLKG